MPTRRRTGAGGRDDGVTGARLTHGADDVHDPQDTDNTPKPNVRSIILAAEADQGNEDVSNSGAHSPRPLAP